MDTTADIPSPEVAIYGVRAILSVARADGVIAPGEREMLQLAAELYDFDFDLDTWESITPDELAMAVTDPKERELLIQVLFVAACIDTEVHPTEAALVRAYAERLGVPLQDVEILEHLAHERIWKLRRALVRRHLGVKLFKRVTRDLSVRGKLKIIGTTAGFTQIPALAARYQTLKDFPEGSVGRLLYDYYEDQGIALPGERFSIPEFLVYHDVLHMLTGYDTKPHGELQVSAFTAGHWDNDPFIIVIILILSLQLKSRVVPPRFLGETALKRGCLDLKMFYCAFQRGRKVKRNPMIEGNLWDYLPMTVDQAREAIGVVEPMPWPSRPVKGAARAPKNQPRGARSATAK